MITIYYAGNTKPEERTCEVFGWPNLDSAGVKQFDNTHFRNLDDAWKVVIKEAEAGVSLQVRNVKQAQSQLQNAESLLVKYTIELQEAKDNFQEYLK